MRSKIHLGAKGSKTEPDRAKWGQIGRNRAKGVKRAKWGKTWPNGVKNLSFLEGISNVFPSPLVSSTVFAIAKLSFNFNFLNLKLHQEISNPLQWFNPFPHRVRWSLRSLGRGVTLTIQIFSWYLIIWPSYQSFCRPKKFLKNLENSL